MIKKTKAEQAFDLFLISLQKEFARSQDTPAGWTGVAINADAAKEWFRKHLSPKQVMENEMLLSTNCK